MIRGKFILLIILTAVSFALSGCSGAATNSNSAAAAAKKESKTAPKLSEKKPVDDLFLAKTKENKDYWENSGYMDKTGKIVIDLRKGLESGGVKYTPVGKGKNKTFLKLMPFVEGLAGFCLSSDPDSGGDYRKDECGFIDRTGNIVVQPTYSDLLAFSEGLAGVAVDTDIYAAGVDAWGFVDPTGKEIVKPQYEAIGSFHDGLAAVGNKDYKYGYIDKTGKPLVELKYTNVSDFGDGFAVVEDLKNYSIIDETGKEVKKLENVKVYAENDFLNYIVSMRDKNGYSGIIASSDKFLSPFHDGVLKVERTDNNYAFVGTDGEPKFTFASPLIKKLGQSTEGFVAVTSTSREIERLKSSVGADRVSDFLDCAYLDAEGKEKGAFYGDLTPFSEGFAGVIKSKEGAEARWGFINTSFDTAIQPVFAKISAFEGGLAWVRVPPDTAGFEGFKDTNWEGYIDTAGKPVIPQWP
jgi:hypothetical protein